MHHEPHPLWRFSLRVYRAPGVQEACLALQDECCADVNLVLLCAFAGHDGRSLDKRRLRQAMARVGHWQVDVIAPVRAARRALKRHPPPDAQAAQELRKRILGVELELEYVEQSMLADLLARWPAPQRRSAPRDAIEANLRRYLDLLGTRPLDAAHVEAIVQAGCGAAPR